METRAIIICAGEATRWNNYLGVPKHLVKIDGEPILYRTVRLLRENGVDDIVIITKNSDERYDVEGTRRLTIIPNYEENADADKFLSSKSEWNTKGRTIVFYGDVYFTDKAIQTIVSYRKKRWTLFCRPGASELTGTPWAECFAQSFYPEHIPEHEKKLHKIAKLYKGGIIDRCGGWEHYRAMVGHDGEMIRKAPITNEKIVVIDDWTEDFDRPLDYDMWMENRKKLILKQ